MRRMRLADKIPIESIESARYSLQIRNPEDALHPQEYQVKRVYRLVREVSKVKQCVICFQESVPTESSCANHYTCQDCFSSFAKEELEVNKKTAVKCPYPSCDFDYTPRLEPDLLEKLRFNQGLHTGLRQCRVCNGVELKLGRLDGKVRNRCEVICASCNASYCLFCKEQLPSTRVLGLLNVKWKHTCMHQELAVHVKDPSNYVKPCPHCFILIHRYEGCRSMVCTGSLGCGKPFCFECVNAMNDSHTCVIHASKSRKFAKLFKQKMKTYLSYLGNS